jgi:hypothetical protein
MTTQDYCWKCQCSRDCKIVRHSSGDETVCLTCGTQVDFSHSEMDDFEESDEPVGSCENCGTNLYPDDDDELCDQCLWQQRM